MKILFFLVFSLSAQALIVEKPEFKETKITLSIVRAVPESFETYSLLNHNMREMILVCAHNRVYDFNPKAFIEYRNFYNEIAGNFILEDDRVCRELGKFIERGQAAINEETPFVITLDKKSLKVEKIIYPKVDVFTDTGDVKDLLPKPLASPKKVVPAKRPELN